MHWIHSGIDCSLRIYPTSSWDLQSVCGALIQRKFNGVAIMTDCWIGSSDVGIFGIRINSLSLCFCNNVIWRFRNGISGVVTAMSNVCGSKIISWQRLKVRAFNLFCNHDIPQSCVVPATGCGKRSWSNERMDASATGILRDNRSGRSFNIPGRWIATASIFLSFSIRDSSFKRSWSAFACDARFLISATTVELSVSIRTGKSRINSHESMLRFTALSSFQLLDIRYCLLDQSPAFVKIPVEAPHPVLEAYVHTVRACVAIDWMESFDQRNSCPVGDIQILRCKCGVRRVSFHHCRHSYNSRSIVSPIRSSCLYLPVFV